MSVRVPSGQIVATPGALAAIEHTGDDAAHYLQRHLWGDWGDVCAADRTANNKALLTGERVLSAYRLHDGTKIWIITEADRSVTTILLPEEY